MKYEIKELKKEEFPEKLKIISKAPEKIYFMGNKELFYKESFGIVGSRKITEYGIENCKYFAREFAYRSIPVVSGLAIGTDSIAHKTTIQYSGETIAVLAHGLNYIYPQENEELVEKILMKNGLILTEHNNNVKPDKKNFPMRNRIISALSEGILVIEAAYRSGTSITVRFAKEQGKKVFSLPGRLDNYLGIGVNNFIKEGAIFTTTIEDILENYPQFIDKKRIVVKPNIVLNEEIENIKTEKIECMQLEKVKKYRRIKEEYKELYNLLEKEKNLQEIIEKTRKNVSEILVILTNMELEGLIKRLGNGNYIIKK